MKKRAIFSTVASLVLAGVMCVGFAACDSGADAKSIEGEIVTKEVWDAAFSNSAFNETYSNFKIDVVSEGENQSSVTYSFKSTGKLTFADGKTYSKITYKVSGVSKEMAALMGAGTTEYYVDESGNAAKYILKTDGSWKEVSNSGDDYISATALLKELFPSDFADYEYSEEYKGYIIKSSVAGYASLYAGETSGDSNGPEYGYVPGSPDQQSPGNNGSSSVGEPTGPSLKSFVVYKFQDGKLKAIYLEVTANSAISSIRSTATYSYVITYGGQSVTLPTISE